MVTDLEHISIRVAAFQEALVPAVLMIAVTELRNADTFPVIPAEMGDIVHVQRSLQRAKGVGGCRIFLLKVHLTKPPLQAFVANIMTFSFADHREQRTVDLSVCQQDAGQQRRYSVCTAFCKAMLEVEIMTGLRSASVSDRLAAAAAAR